MANSFVFIGNSVKIEWNKSTFIQIIHFIERPKSRKRLRNQQFLYPISISINLIRNPNWIFKKTFHIFLFQFRYHNYRKKFRSQNNGVKVFFPLHYFQYHEIYMAEQSHILIVSQMKKNTLYRKWTGEKAK